MAQAPTAAPQNSISLDNYIRDKRDGICKIVKLNGQPVYSMKEYTRAGDEVVVNAALDKAQLQQLAEQLQAKLEAATAELTASLASVKEALADIDKAQELMPKK